MARINDRGLIDDGSANLEISGALIVHGSVSLPNLVSPSQTQFRTVSTSNSMTEDDDFVEITAANVVFTLLAPAGNGGRRVTIKNSSDDVATVATSSGLIEGETSLQLFASESIDLRSNDVDWVIT